VPSDSGGGIQAAPSRAGTDADPRPALCQRDQVRLVSTPAGGENGVVESPRAGSQEISPLMLGALRSRRLNGNSFRHCPVRPRGQDEQVGGSTLLVIDRQVDATGSVA
jgi:hypothetical protein